MAVSERRALPGVRGAVDLERSSPDVAWRAALGDATRAMLDADARVFLHGADPRLDVVQRAHGATLIDRDGREILDFDGGGVHAVGYGHPRVIAAVKAQIEALAVSPRGYTNPPTISLAQRLAELAPPGLDKVLLAPGNAGAIASALKIARSATGRHRVLAMGDAFTRAEPPAGIEHLPPLDTMLAGDDRGPMRLAEMVDAVVSRSGDFAALLAEPMGWATATTAPPDFWPRVKQACARAGTFLIFDETPSAVGRTGTLFACEQTGVVPDLLVIGEGLGAGIVPIAAIVGHEVLAQDAAHGPADHKNPLGAVAAMAMLEAIVEDELLERARGLGHGSLDHLKALAARNPVFREARGAGLSLGLELASLDAAERAERMRYACLEGGLNFRVGAGRVILLTPPLTITVPEIERALQIIEAAAADC